MAFRRKLSVAACLASTVLLLEPGAPMGVLAAPAPQKLPLTVETQISALLQAPEVAAGHVGLSIAALGRATGPEQFALEAYDAEGTSAPPPPGSPPRMVRSKPLLQKDARKRFLPASNMKLFTAAWVLARFGPDARIETEAVVRPPQGRGKGGPSLTLVGHGDPSFNSSALKQLLARVPRGPWTEEMIQVDPGGLTADQFGGRYPDGWTLDDTLWDYGAPVTGLVVDRNAVDITIRGTEPGKVAQATLSRPLALRVVNKVVTGSPGTPARISIDRLEGGPEMAGSAVEALSPQFPGGFATVVVTGSVGPGASVTENLAIPNPVQVIKREVLAQIRDGSRRWARDAWTPAGTETATATVAGGKGAAETQMRFVHQSAPMGEILAGFLKPSDNLYGEVLLRRAALALPLEPGESAGRKGPGGCTISSVGLASRAHGDMARWLSGQGVDVSLVRFSDGSGLSRYNLITPQSVVELLEVAAWMPGGEAFYRALPVAGVDGTLRRRYQDTAAAGNVRAKTGTFSIANCLSGYVTTQDGHRLAVSILTDFVPNGGEAREWQGKIFAALAGCRLDAEGGQVAMERAR